MQLFSSGCIDDEKIINIPELTVWECLAARSALLRAPQLFYFIVSIVAWTFFAISLGSGA